MKKIKRALISVSNKKNLRNLLKILKKFNVEIISSGGTFKEIKRLKFRCIEVSDYTNFPEILGGRLKTLHPKIHGGILNIRNNKKHSKDLKKNNFKNIDLVIVNFYTFEIFSSSAYHCWTTYINIFNNIFWVFGFKYNFLEWIKIYYN